MSGVPTIGLVLPRELPPGEVPSLAAAAEAAGLDELWLVEDLPYTGGVAAAALALGATSRLTVGIGILPAAVRNVAFAAMDLATLACAYPGRLHVGLGHGVAGWLRQVGALPRSPLGCLRETTTALRRLLAGEAVTVEGAYVQLDDVRLVHAPPVVPPVSLGVRGPRSVALAAEVADGLVLAEPAPPAYLAACRALLDASTEGAAAGSASAAVGTRRLAAYTWSALGTPREELAASLAPIVRVGLEHGDLRPHLAGLPRAEDLDRWAGTTEALPADWLDELVLTGDAAQGAAAVMRLAAAGADAVLVVPCAPEPPEPVAGPDRVTWLRSRLAPLAALVAAVRHSSAATEAGPAPDRGKERT